MKFLPTPSTKTSNGNAGKVIGKWSTIRNVATGGFWLGFALFLFASKSLFFLSVLAYAIFFVERGGIQNRITRIASGWLLEIGMLGLAGLLFQQEVNQWLGILPCLLICERIIKKTIELQCVNPALSKLIRLVDEIIPFTFLVWLFAACSLLYPWLGHWYILIAILILFALWANGRQ